MLDKNDDEELDLDELLALLLPTAVARERGNRGDDDDDACFIGDFHTFPCLA